MEIQQGGLRTSPRILKMDSKNAHCRCCVRAVIKQLSRAPEEKCRCRGLEARVNEWLYVLGPSLAGLRAAWS